MSDENEMIGIAGDPFMAAIETIRHGLDAAFTPELVREVDASRFDLRIAQSGLQAAGAHLAGIERQSATSAALDLSDARRDAVAARDAAERDLTEAQARMTAAVSEAGPRVLAALAQPLEAQRQLVLALLAGIERACDPVLDLHAALSVRGLPVPQAVTAVPPALDRLREIRRGIDRGTTAQLLLSAAAEHTTP